MASTASQKVLRDAFLGFMRIHVLHHAAKAPVYGLEMSGELKRHGYVVGPGTLYPMLHASGGAPAQATFFSPGCARRSASW
jgi:hypothetical protein